jgi:hypothetical protein
MKNGGGKKEEVALIVGFLVVALTPAASQGMKTCWAERRKGPKVGKLCAVRLLLTDCSLPLMSIIVSNLFAANFRMACDLPSIEGQKVQT